MEDLTASEARTAEDNTFKKPEKKVNKFTKIKEADMKH